MSPNTPLLQITPVLKRYKKALENLGIHTAEDLLRYFPFRYEDYSTTVPLNKVTPGAEVTVKVRIEQIKNRRSFRGRRRLITEAVVADDTERAKVVWFGQYYLVKTYSPGAEVFLAGKPRRVPWGIEFISPTIEPVRKEQTHTGRIVPIYRVSGRLSVKHLRYAAKAALPAAAQMEEWLPKEVIKEFSLPSLPKSIKEIHFPSKEKALVAAQKRFAVEQLLLHILTAERARSALQAASAPEVPFPEEAIKMFVEELPFKLTNGQRRAAWDILQDLEHPRPMHRLLNGDVGSGKTAVATIALYAVAKQGGQGAFLVPTDILARQHIKSLTDFFKNIDVTLVLLTASESSAFKKGERLSLPDTKIGKSRMVRAMIADGRADVVVGTHSLLEDKIQFRDLRLAVIDEQHRFGVRQRQALHRKRTDDALPHLLSLTATPIPRTLALSASGGLDVSVLPMRPIGRTVATVVCVGEEGVAKADAAIENAIKQKHQVMVVCPLISESEDDAKHAVETEYERLSKRFSNYSVVMMHGKLPAAKKQSVMEDVLNGNVDVLVATTVIEVGIDVQNATVMVIRSADRFGLAQLHQLRGRVGRGEHPGSCYLLTENESPASISRLRATENCIDGFALAEMDLKIRGPGEIFGTVQSGTQGFWTTGIFDMRWISTLQRILKDILKTDSEGKIYPELFKQLERFEEQVHFE